MKQFEFDGKILAILAAGLCLILCLTFAAGLVTGVALWMPTRKELALLKEQPPAHAPVQMAAAPAPAAAPPTPAPAPTQPVQQPAAPATAPAPVPAEAPKTAEAAPQPGAPAPTAIAGNSDLFSLQLGSFLDAKNAKQLQSDLKEKGYNSIIFTALDGEQREWHVVRIGGFKTMVSAAQAAADFAGKERMAAFVRRSDRL